MPEADRFERKLPRHWRKPYRVALSGGDQVEIFVDCVMPAVRETLLLHAKPEGIFATCELLFAALTSTNGAQQSLIAYADQVGALGLALDQLEKERERELCIRVLARAARCVFASWTNEQNVGEPAFKDVRDALAAEFGRQLVANQLLARVASSLMEARGRDFVAQEHWERAFYDALAPQMQALFRTMFIRKRIPSRSPIRLAQPMKMTRDELLLPIDLSGTDK